MDDFLARIMGYANQGTAPFGALATTPPQQEPMTRALPDYESRDPNELAMLRHREMVRPQTGRADFTPEHLANMATAAGGLALAPEYLAARAIMAAPKLAAGGIGAAAALSPSKAGAEEPDQIKQLQATLKKGGYYRGPIDGRMGPETQRAKQAADEADKLRVQQEQETARLRLQSEGIEAEKMKAQAALTTGNAQQAETERQRIADETRRAQREQGNERLRQMESDLPWYRRAVRDYAAPVGYAFGALAGAGARAGVTKASNALSDRAAREAEKLVAAPAKGLPARVAQTNEFWRKGGGEVPFLPTPNAAPGFAANPKAAAMDTLYAPSRAKNAATDLGISGAFGLESGVGQFVLSPAAQEELRAANEAAAVDPSEVNIRRLQAAKDKASIMEAATNFGRAGAITYPAAALKMQRNSSVPKMTNAEAERLKIEELLRKRAAKQPIAPEELPVVQRVGVPPSLTGPGAWRARQM